MAKTIRHSSSAAALSISIGALAMAWSWGCSDPQPEAPPSAPPTAELEPDKRSAAEVLDAILERNHGERRGSFGRAVVEIRETPSDTATIASLDLPRNLRLDHPKGPHLLLRGERAWHRTPHGAETLAADATTDLRRWRGALAATFLEPLFQCTRPVRDGRDRLTLHTPDAVWSLTFDPDSLRPRELRRNEPSPAFPAVEFLECFDSGTTLIPEKIKIDGIGTRLLRIIDNDVQFNEVTFKVPDQPVAKPPAMVITNTPEPASPEFQKVRAVRWMMTEDPVDWSIRKQALRELGQLLYEGGQKNGGNPFLINDDGQDWLVIPFVTDPSQGGKVFQPGPDDIVRDSPEHVAAVVYPAKGEKLDDRIGAGETSLREFLKQHQVAAEGELRAVLNLFYENSDTTKARRQLTLRLELPTKRR